MKVKILFNTINLENEAIDPIYIPQSGTITDKHSGNILYKFIELEATNYFYFKIEFSHYQYILLYQPKSLSYKNVVAKRIYNLYLYLNISAISNISNISKTLNRKLTHYFTMLQIKEIKEKKNYHTNEKTIGQYINYRYLNNFYLIPWYHYRINSNHVFDLKHKTLLGAKHVTKINCKRKGCIIETNNVVKLIQTDYFQVTREKTLIILPSNMVNLWPNALTLTYDQFLCFSKEDANNIRNQNISQIIIHECHEQFLVGIKNLVDIIKCKYIWVINSLPLRYYFSADQTPTKLKINELATISNLWFNFSKIEKKKYKTEIIKMLLTKLNQMYTIVKYNTNYTDIDTIKLPMTDFEKYTHGIFNTYYENWKNKLTNDPNNIYSITTKKKNTKIESKIYNAVITLITSVVSDTHVPIFFKNSIKNILNKTIKVNVRLDCLIKNYYEANKTTRYKNTDNDIINFDYILADLNDKKNKTNTRISNYKRYLDGTVYHSFNDKCCPICYSSEDLIKSKLICGHFICLDCILSTLSSSSKCPVCNEFININKIAIIEDTINNYYSNIMSYIKNINNTTLLLTDLTASTNIIHNTKYKNNIIDINKSNVMNKIKKIQKIDNIVLLITPENMISPNILEELEKVIGFFQLFNKKPKISRIEVII